uniref:Heat shock protein 70 n=1 Tax=Panagrolaimus davidi TaxID=227884 RepID=A0A914NYF7_9BILA
MPSYVAYDEKKPICGQAVINRMCYKTEYSVYDIKRIIGSKPTDKETVITIPCEFTHSQKSSLKMAAEIAGWETVHFLPEPVAAAFAYFSETDIPHNSNILICDCGGGTVDICIAHVSNGQIKIICFEGDSNIGGRDFDRALFNHFSTILNNKYGVDVMKTVKKFELKQKCQDIKHTLSVCNNAWIDVCDYVFDGEGIIEITKDEFETMTADLLLRIKNVINNTLSKANMEKGQINYVFQVGGGSRMPMIKDVLENVFRNANRKCLIYPDWAVAHGAALYAYYLKTKEHSSVTAAKKSTISW